MLFKEEGFRINQEDFKKVAEKSIAFGKTTAKVATKVTQIAVSEVKKEIDNHKLNSKK